MDIYYYYSQGIRWQKWAPYLRLGGRGRCTATRPEWQAARNRSVRVDCGAF